MEQKIFIADKNYSALSKYISENKLTKILLVHGKTFYKIPIANFFSESNISVVHFTDFEPNPDYKSVVAGVEVFQKENCNAIMAIGGGSAIDVAKCIKLFAKITGKVDFLQQAIVPNEIPLIVFPTTIGTGAESTHFAVIYRDENKISVGDKSALPSVIIADVSAFKLLSDYQKKSGIADALCHSLEAAWSINSNEIARAFSFEAIRLIYTNKNLYLESSPSENCLSLMFYASRLAGKAIEIARTTAGHAMSYCLTKKFGIAHGHAAALCTAEVWDYMNKNCNDELKNIFSHLAACMGFSNVEDAISDFKNTLTQWNFDKPLSVNATETEIDFLSDSVNIQRLSNNPLKLDKSEIKNIYTKILKRSLNEG